MPLYEYKCKDCNETFEVMQKFSDEPVSSCIHCAGEVEKLISQSSFILKGGGWYLTDYAGKKSEDKTPKKDSCPTPEKSPACSTCPSSQS